MIKNCFALLLLVISGLFGQSAFAGANDFKVFIFGTEDIYVFAPAKTQAEARTRVQKQITFNTGATFSDGELPFSKECGNGWIAQVEAFWDVKHTFGISVSCNGNNEAKTIASAIKTCSKKVGMDCLMADHEVRITWSYFDGKNPTNRNEWYPDFTYKREAFFGDKPNHCSKSQRDPQFSSDYRNIPCNLPAGVGQ